MFSKFMPMLDTPMSEHSETPFELVAEEDRKKFVCKHPGCGKFFRYKSEIVRHTATHSESRPFICNYDGCFKAFKRNDALENHVRSSHTKETPFVCPFPECAMKFTTHGSFRYHVLKHNKQIPAEAEAAVHNHEMLPNPSLPRKQMKIDTFNIPEPSFVQEPFKFIEGKSDKLGNKGESEEFYVPPPRFAGKIQWQMMDDDAAEEEIEIPAPKIETVPKEKYDSVVEENQILKGKLGNSDKIIKNMQKQMNELLNNLFVCQSQLASVQSNQSMTTGSPQTSQKEEPLFDMINYNDDNTLFKTNMGSPAVEPLFMGPRENSLVDSFLSFGKELEGFEF
jgi:hypothetical protein